MPSNGDETSCAKSRIDPDDGDRQRRLYELERETVAQQFAAHSRQSFAKNAPDRFRGRAQAYTTPAGVSHTIVSDGSRFVVVRTAESRQLDGQAVTIARDGKARLLVRPAVELEMP